MPLRIHCLIWWFYNCIVWCCNCIARFLVLFFMRVCVCHTQLKDIWFDLIWWFMTAEWSCCQSSWNTRPKQSGHVHSNQLAHQTLHHSLCVSANWWINDEVSHYWPVNISNVFMLECNAQYWHCNSVLPWQTLSTLWKRPNVSSKCFHFRIATSALSGRVPGCQKLQTMA